MTTQNEDWAAVLSIWLYFFITRDGIPSGQWNGWIKGKIIIPEESDFYDVWKSKGKADVKTEGGMDKEKVRQSMY